MIKDLDIILSEGESYTVEFKESADKTLASEVCAFANASGGKIFIGVSDDGRIVGTDTSNAARSRVQDTINQIEPTLPVEIDIQDNITIIIVPQGKNKPYSCSKGFYMRFGPNSQKLERNDIIEFFQSEGHIRYDEIVRTDLPITENFNDVAYKQYMDMAKISDVLNKISILRNLGCAEIVDDKVCFTNAGALFFRKNDDDIQFRHAAIVCALYKGNDKVYILDAKEFSGGIVNSIDETILFLKKHLKLSYEIKGTQRENILEIPEDALRESVVNAVCHRNYFEKGSRVMIEIFDDRVDITSPGSVAKGITKENFGTVSITRNSIIASMLHRIRYIEQMGTGINRIKDAVKTANLTAPIFEMSEFFKVTFERIKKIENGDKVAINNGDKIAINFEKQKEIIINYLKENNKITTAQIAVMLDLKNSRARAIAFNLTKNNVLEAVGSNKNRYYTLK